MTLFPWSNHLEGNDPSQGQVQVVFANFSFSSSVIIFGDGIPILTSLLNSAQSQQSAPSTHWKYRSTYTRTYSHTPKHLRTVFLSFSRLLLYKHTSISQCLFLSHTLSHSLFLFPTFPLSLSLSLTHSRSHLLSQNSFTARLKSAPLKMIALIKK